MGLKGRGEERGEVSGCIRLNGGRKVGKRQAAVHEQSGKQTGRKGREDDCQHSTSQLCLDEPLKEQNSLHPHSVLPKHTQEYTPWESETPGHARMYHEHMYAHAYCNYQGKQLFSAGHLSQMHFGTLQLYFFLLNPSPGW